jgi:streptogramin lyase
VLALRAMGHTGRRLVGSAALIASVLLLVGVAPAAASSVTLYHVPTSGAAPWGITNGPDGALWFTEDSGDNLGRISTSGAIHEFPLPAGSGALGLTTGPDGNLWVAAHGRDQILRVTPTGVVTGFDVPDGRIPYDIASGPDGNLWFTAQPPTAGGGITQGAIDRITTSCQITIFPLTSATRTAPWYITRGPDGNLWFTEQRTVGEPGFIAESTTGGQITEYPIPTSGAIPLAIAAGPDGNLWFTDQNHGMIGQSSISGQIKEFAAGGSSLIQGIASGPDGALWFADPYYGSLSRITTGGAATKSLLPGASPGSGPQVLNDVTGPDHALWFTVRGQNEIGRMVPGAAAAQGCTVPALVGLTLGAARAKLAAAHCKLGTVSRHGRGHHRKGTIIGQRPPAGTALANRAAVAVTVAK